MGSFLKFLLVFYDKELLMPDREDIPEDSVLHSQVNAMLTDWHKFYADVFGITVDLSGLQMPTPREGFTRLIVVIPGITIERVMTACKERFPVWWIDDNLDEITTSVRSVATSAYAVWVRDRIEADEEHANKSYNDLRDASINGITLLERLLLELKYHSETGQHLDIINITLCTGSLDRDGLVPDVCSRNGGLYVKSYGRDYAFGFLCVREVVQ
jgi:hypothetical protein